MVLLPVMVIAIMNQISTSAVTDDDNPIPGLTPGQSWDMGEPIHESEIPGGGTAYSYDPIVIPPTE